MARSVNALSVALLLTVVACDDESTVVGPEGGIVSSPDGRVALMIPAGALDEEIAISIDEIDDGPENAVGPAYEITPRLTFLNAPADIVYDFGLDAEERQLPLTDMSNARIVTETADGWAPLSDHEIDLEEGTAIASVLYFSSYSIVIE
jgi:hypothetical protein